MYTLILNAAETATLLMLNAAVLDVINGDISEDTIEELKAIQADLEHILFKEESSCNSQPKQHKSQPRPIGANK